MRLISSGIALAVTVALAATDRLGLTEIARAVGSPTSAVQRALSVLIDDGIVGRSTQGRPTYALHATQRAATILALALAELRSGPAVTIGARANPSIELVARDADTLVVVFAAASTAHAQASAARFLERIAAQESVRIAYRDHDDVRRDVLADPSIRRRMARARILHGDLDRTFPDRSRHGPRAGRPLQRANGALRRVPRSLTRRLAREHRLSALRLFGSAVRSDFRPDSDVDVLVRYGPGTRPSLRSLLALEHALEGAFGRDVDLIREELLPSEMHERIAREAVSLL